MIVKSGPFWGILCCLHVKAVDNFFFVVDDNDVNFMGDKDGSEL